MSIESRVKEVIALQLGLQSEEINLSDNIYDDLGADSLDGIEILMSIEEEFEVDIADEDVSNLDDTVQSIVDHVAKVI